MPRKSTTQPTDPLAGLRLPPVHEWVRCELDDVNEGLVEPLEIRVLVNPPRADILAMSMAVDAVFTRARERIEAAQKNGETGIDPDVMDADDRELMEIIAPRIVAWNVIAENAEGERVNVWPPAEAPSALMLLNPRQRGWVLRIVQSAHLGGDTRSKLSRRPAATASTEDAKTPSGPQIVDIPTGETPRSRRKSS